MKLYVFDYPNMELPLEDRLGYLRSLTLPKQVRVIDPIVKFLLILFIFRDAKAKNTSLYFLIRYWRKEEKVLSYENPSLNIWIPEVSTN